MNTTISNNHPMVDLATEIAELTGNKNISSQELHALTWGLSQCSDIFLYRITCLVERINRLLSGEDSTAFYRYLDKHFFAYILWSDEDIENELMAFDYEPTPENVAAVRAQEYILDSLNTCYDEDWEVIDDAIKAAEDSGTLK